MPMFVWPLVREDAVEKDSLEGHKGWWVHLARTTENHWKEESGSLWKIRSQRMRLILLLIGLVEEVEEQVSRGWGHMQSKYKKCTFQTLWKFLVGDACYILRLNQSDSAKSYIHITYPGCTYICRMGLALLQHSTCAGHVLREFGCMLMIDFSAQDQNHHSYMWKLSEMIGAEYQKYLFDKTKLRVEKHN